MCKADPPQLSPSIKLEGEGSDNTGENDASATTRARLSASLKPVAKESSGCTFYPPSDRYWLIGGKWYDFTDFLDKHPGGSTVMKLARVSTCAAPA
jgi:hypothetical protein